MAPIYHKYFKSRKVWAIAPGACALGGQTSKAAPASPNARLTACSCGGTKMPGWARSNADGRCVGAAPMLAEERARFCGSWGSSHWQADSDIWCANMASAHAWQGSRWKKRN
jgi:hypothetical protein